MAWIKMLGKKSSTIKKKIYTYNFKCYPGEYVQIIKRDGNTGEQITFWNNAGSDGLIQVYYSYPNYYVKALVPAVYNGQTTIGNLFANAYNVSCDKSFYVEVEE